MKRIILAVAAAVALAGLGDASAGNRKKSVPGKIDPAVLYHNYCSVCHGDKGDGNSRAKNSLVPPPANFTDVKLQGKLTPEYMAAIIRDGKPGTAMVGWKTQLNDAEVAALSGYVRRSFVDHAGDAAVIRGRSVYGHFCVNCHGVDGTGRAAANATAVRDLTSEASRRELTRERIITALAVGVKDTPMGGFAGQLSPADMEAVVEYLRKSLMASGGAAISGTSAHGGRERDPPPAR